MENLFTETARDRYIKHLWLSIGYASALLIALLLTILHNPFWWIAFCGMAVLFATNLETMRKERKNYISLMTKLGD